MSEHHRIEIVYDDCGCLQVYLDGIYATCVSCSHINEDLEQTRLAKIVSSLRESIASSAERGKETDA